MITHTEDLDMIIVELRKHEEIDLGIRVILELVINEFKSHRRTLNRLDYSVSNIRGILSK